MNKITLAFNHHTNGKLYDFVTKDNTITYEDLVCVTSPISKKGFAVAVVQEVEKDTGDLEHIEIISKLKYSSKLVERLYFAKFMVQFDIYLTEGELYFKDTNYTTHIAKQLSYLLDREFDDYVLVNNNQLGGYYKLTKSKVPSEHCFEIDLLINKIYINVEELDFDGVDFMYYLKNLTVSVDEEKHKLLKTKLEPIQDFYIDDTYPDDVNGSYLAKKIIRETFSEDMNIITYRHHGFHVEEMLDDYFYDNVSYFYGEEVTEETIRKFNEEHGVFNDAELQAIEGIGFNQIWIDSHTIEPLFLTSLSEKDKLKIDNKIPVRGKLFSAGKVGYTYLSEIKDDGYYDDNDEYIYDDSYCATICFYFEESENNELSW